MLALSAPSLLAISRWVFETGYWKAILIEVNSFSRSLAVAVEGYSAFVIYTWCMRLIIWFWCSVNRTQTDVRLRSASKAISLRFLNSVRPVALHSYVEHNTRQLNHTVAARPNWCASLHYKTWTCGPAKDLLGWRIRQCYLDPWLVISISLRVHHHPRHFTYLTLCQNRSVGRNSLAFRTLAGLRNWAARITYNGMNAMSDRQDGGIWKFFPDCLRD